MTRKAVVLTVLAVVGVVGLVGGLGWDERRRGEGELGWLADKLVNGWGREVEPGIAFSDSVYVEGPAMSDWCKTKVTARWEASFDIAFLSPENGQMDWPVDHYWIAGGLGGVGEVRVECISSVQDENGNWFNQVSFRACVNPAYPDQETVNGATVLYPADGNVYSVSCSLGGGSDLRKRAGDTPIGTKTNATHAKERWAEEGWGVPDGQIIYATIAGYTAQAEAVESVDPGAVGLGFQCYFHSRPLEGDLMRYESIAFNAAHIDASGLTDRPVNPNNPNGPRVVGSGTTIRYYSPAAGSVIGVSHYSWVGPPIEYSFSRLAVRALGTGALLDDLELWFSGAQEYDATDEAWHYLKKTLAAWRSANLRPNWGIYSWDTDPPPDGALRTLPTAQFAIDRDSAKAHYLEAAGSDA